MNATRSPAKLGLLLALYFCQGLPGGFLAVALPVILRQQGRSLTEIGLASAVSLPWTLKILWAPLVDRYGSPKFGRRKSWLVPAQAGIVAVTAALVFVPPHEGVFAVVVLFLVLNTFAATQDIAVDGLAVDMLGPADMGPGNAAQIGGFKLGNLMGGGVLLALIGVIGWSGDFMVMATVVAVVMFVVILTPERALVGARARASTPTSTAAVVRELWQALVERGWVFWLFLAYAKFGETFGGAMIKPMLVDRDFSAAQIGVIDGLVGAIATIAGAAVAGLITRVRGWAITLAGFTVIQGLSLIAIGIYTQFEITPVGIAVLGGFENFAGGGVGVAIFALGMSIARPSVGATHFTAIQVIYMSGAFVAAPLSGAVAGATDYIVVLIAGGAMAIGLAAIALTYGRRVVAATKAGPAADTRSGSSPSAGRRPD